MRRKNSYRAAAMIKWALPAHLFSILWFVLTDHFLAEMSGTASSQDIEKMLAISLAGFLLIPPAVIASLALFGHGHSVRGKG